MPSAILRNDEGSVLGQRQIDPATRPHREICSLHEFLRAKTVDAADLHGRLSFVDALANDGELLAIWAPTRWLDRDPAALETLPPRLWIVRFPQHVREGPPRTSPCRQREARTRTASIVSLAMWMVPSVP